MTNATNQTTERDQPTLDGWIFEGLRDVDATDTEAGIEPGLRQNGKPVAFVRSAVDVSRHGVFLYQLVLADRYHGKRIRFSADLRNDRDDILGRMWLRVVPASRSSNYAWGFADATTEWGRGEIVVDVDPRAHAILFGVSIWDCGKVWMSDARFEIVDDSIPLTGEASDLEPPEPVNLSFEG